MKVIIEDGDIKAVRRSAERYGVALTDAQARSLIEGSQWIKSELIDCCGMIDQDECVSDALVEAILGGSVPDNEDASEMCRTWAWPCYGSTKAYTREFYTKFKARAAEMGYDVSAMTMGE